MLTVRQPRLQGEIRPRDYQIKALADIARAAVKRLLLVMPTGTGKTIVFATLIARTPGRSLVLVHRDELIEQAVAKLKLVAPHLKVGIVKAERNEIHAPVIVASVQTLLRPNRLAQLSTDFALGVVDEAHHATANSYVRILTEMRCFERDGPLLLGVTATTERGDGIGLGRVFEAIINTQSLPEFMAAGILCDLSAVRIGLAVNLDRLQVRGGDFAVDQLDDALRAANAPRHLVTAHRTHAAGRKTLLFTPSVRSAHEMAAAFCADGVTAEALDGAMPLDERRAILARFHTGVTSLVSNCGVLTEGYDEPSIECIVPKPTRSPLLFRQMLGRGMRVHPGKQNLLVLDPVGVTTQHSLVTTASLFGLEPDELTATTSVLDALSARQAAPRRAHADQTLVGGQLVAAAVDLFKRRPLHWVTVNADRYVLTIGEAGQLLLTTDDAEHWQVVHVARTRERVVLAKNLDLAYAQGTAEDFARSQGADRLANPNARWRHAPASEKQLAALGRWRIPIPPHCTKGEAADLLTAAIGGVA